MPGFFSVLGTFGDAFLGPSKDLFLFFQKCREKIPSPSSSSHFFFDVNIKRPIAEMVISSCSRLLSLASGLLSRGHQITLGFSEQHCPTLRIQRERLHRYSCIPLSVFLYATLTVHHGELAKYFSRGSPNLHNRIVHRASCAVMNEYLLVISNFHLWLFYHRGILYGGRRCISLITLGQNWPLYYAPGQTSFSSAWRCIVPLCKIHQLKATPVMAPTVQMSLTFTPRTERKAKTWTVYWNHLHNSDIA